MNLNLQETEKRGHPACQATEAHESKDQNIGKHGYIGNWILRKYRRYRKISVDIFTKISVRLKFFIF